MKDLFLLYLIGGAIFLNGWLLWIGIQWAYEQLVSREKLSRIWFEIKPVLLWLLVIFIFYGIGTLLGGEPLPPDGPGGRI